MSAPDALDDTLGKSGDSGSVAAPSIPSLSPLEISPADLSMFIAPHKSDGDSNAVVLASTSSSFNWDDNDLVKELFSL